MSASGDVPASRPASAPPREEIVGRPERLLTREGIPERPERLLAFLLAAYALVSAWDFSLRPACIDYYQFWVVGRAVAARETRDVYSDAERKRLGELYQQRALAQANPEAGERAPRAPTKRLQAARQRPELETYSTPWFYTLFGFLSGADYDRSQDLFQRASLLAYVAAIALLAFLLRLSRCATALWIAALLQWFNPFVDDVLAGNVNRFQLLLLAVFLWIECRARFPGRHAAAGALLGATLAFKPNLAAIAAILILGWSLRGEMRRLLHSLAGQAAGALAAVLVSAAYFGSFAPWAAWLRELPRLMAAGSPAAGSADEGNYSLARLLRDSAGITLGPALPALLFLAAIGALVLERRRRLELERPSSLAVSPDHAAGVPIDDAGAAPREILLVGLGAAFSLLATELAWQHYFVAIVPLAMVLLSPANGETAARVAPRVIALAGLAMVSLQNVGRLFDLHHPAAGAAVIASGTLLLFLMGLVKLVGWSSLARPRSA